MVASRHNGASAKLNSNLESSATSGLILSSSRSPSAASGRGRTPLLVAFAPFVLRIFASSAQAHRRSWRRSVLPTRPAVDPRPGRLRRRRTLVPTPSTFVCDIEKSEYPKECVFDKRECAQADSRASSRRWKLTRTGSVVAERASDYYRPKVTKKA
jgi:type II secretory pathway component HofQ